MLKVRRHFGRDIEINDSFATDLENGLSSANFDILSSNSNDIRAGLDDNAKQQIHNIMISENLSFDKARLVFIERKFGQNFIAPDGMPMDPKAVTFSS